jgi:hypothetical protein
VLQLRILKHLGSGRLRPGASDVREVGHIVAGKIPLARFSRR